MNVYRFLREDGSRDETAIFFHKVWWTKRLREMAQEHGGLLAEKAKDWPTRADLLIEGEVATEELRFAEQGFTRRVLRFVGTAAASFILVFGGSVVVAVATLV